MYTGGSLGLMIVFSFLGTIVVLQAFRRDLLLDLCDNVIDHLIYLGLMLWCIICNADNSLQSNLDILAFTRYYSGSIYAENHA